MLVGFCVQLNTVVMIVFSIFMCSAKGQNFFNLTGSTEFALLGDAFTWTCEIFLPPGQGVSVVEFYRNQRKVGYVGMFQGSCVIGNPTDTYKYACRSESSYTLTIPELTEYEDSSVWSCQFAGDSNYKSPNVILHLSIYVYNVSLTPSDYPLTIREGVQMRIWCEVNSNAAPKPTITWYLGSTDITKTSASNTTSIIITGNRTDNKKTLQCSATNNNKPLKTASTNLYVEYPPYVLPLSQQVIIEGENLTVTCEHTPGNPNSTTFFWTKVDIQSFKHNGAILQIPDIQRNSSGTYRCIAENTFYNGEKGTHSQEMNVNVLYPPYVFPLSQQVIIEGENLTVTCKHTPGNPNSTTFFWIKVDNLLFIQNRAILRIPNIQRSSSGTYRCTAENIFYYGNKGTHSQEMDVNVLYPPYVFPLSQQVIIEGENLTVTCNYKPGNPHSTTVFWTKVDNQTFKHNGTILQIPNIQRNSSGTYRCTAENTFYKLEKGTHSQEMNVNVLYKGFVDKPAIEVEPRNIVNETDTAVLTGTIKSNPLSNISWFDGSIVLETHRLVENSSFIIMKASCANSKNFTLVASNIVQENVTANVELIVNCKPIADNSNITLGVSDTSEIGFSTTVVAYPRPQCELKYKNGTTNNEITITLTTNAVNNFTFHFNQTVVKPSDYDTYHLYFSNSVGETIVLVNVIPQKRPDPPRTTKRTCEVTTARVQWVSSFNGGDHQTFTAFAYIGQQEASRSEVVADAGENKIHHTTIQNLQPSTEYVFYVSAKNGYGNTSSEKIHCITVKKESTINYGVEVAAGASGGLALIVILILLLYVFHKRYTFDSNIMRIGRRKRIHKKEKGSSHYETTVQRETDSDTYNRLTRTTGAEQCELPKRNENQESTVMYENTESKNIYENQVTAVIGNRENNEKNAAYEYVETRDKPGNQVTATEKGSSKQLEKPLETTSKEYVNLSLIN